VALTKVVSVDVPFHETDEFAVKLEPLTVRVNAGLPACAEDGPRLLIAGVFPDVMVNSAPLDTTPFALTVTAAVPLVAMRLAATDAVN
jgi:hypothetical protein